MYYISIRVNTMKGKGTMNCLNKTVTFWVNGYDKPLTGKVVCFNQHHAGVDYWKVQFINPLNNQVLIRTFGEVDFLSIK